MWFYVLSFLLRVSLAWWPGGTQHWATAPEYPRTITVTAEVHVPNLPAALAEWNACGSVQLVRGTAGDITVLKAPPGAQEAPYGWYSDGKGYVAVDEGWTRSREILEHELGHALGFGHAPDVVNSIMSAASHVKPLDCEGLRRYYG